MRHGAFLPPLCRQTLLVGVLFLGIFSVGCDGKDTDNPPSDVETPSSDVETCATSADTCGPNTVCEDLEPGTFEGTIGYVCGCEGGFEPAEEGCSDTDECEEGFHNCSMNATCTNTEGAFECACNEGYEGDGEDCELPPLSAEVIELAGKYLTAQMGLREAVIFGSTDGVIDLDDDGTLSILDMIAARCAAFTTTDGELFPEMSRGCPILGEVQVDRFLSLEPVVEGECSEDADCTGESPGTPRCVSAEATCRCLPIGRSGLSECQPQFP